MTALLDTDVQEALGVFQTFWRTWADKPPDTLPKLLALLDDDVTLIGTGENEIRVGIGEARTQIEIDLSAISDPVSLTFHWYRARAVDAVVLVEAATQLRIPMHGDWLDLGVVRVSGILKKEGGRWVIAHIHTSFPRADEAFPIEEVLAQNRALERQVAERTEALQKKTDELSHALDVLKATQAQLIQQEKLASLGQLTAGIAHEIKNPLNFVNNFAEVNEELAQELREAIAGGEDLTALVDDLEQNARVIAQHGRRADGIVRAMMQHASGGAGRRETTDLNALVSEHIDLAYHGKRAQVTELQVEIERGLGTGVGAVEVVPQEMGRVLLNLLSNAFDAVHERAVQANGAYAPQVAVATRRVGDRVEIRVSDNGMGVPLSVRDKIFEPFFTTKPTGSGTGLGLSLSYDIVTQGHGGTLTVESTEGEGATFVIALPADPGP